MATPAYRGSDGRTYYTVAGAANRLALTEPQVRGLIARHELSEVAASVLTDSLPAVRGRRPTKVIPTEEVEARRQLLLEALGAIEPTDPAAQGVALPEHIAALEEANAQLRGEVGSLREMLRLALVAEEAHLEQLRQALAPSLPPQ